MTLKTLGLMVGIVVFSSSLSCTTEATPVPKPIDAAPTATATPARTPSPTISPLQIYVVQMGMVARSVNENFSNIGRLLEIQAFGDSAWRRDVLAPFDDIAGSNDRVRQFVPPTRLAEAHQRALSGYGLFVDAGELLSEILVEAADRGVPVAGKMEEVSKLINLGREDLAIASALMEEAIGALNVPDAR